MDKLGQGEPNVSFLSHFALLEALRLLCGKIKNQESRRLRWLCWARSFTQSRFRTEPWVSETWVSSISGELMIVGHSVGNCLKRRPSFISQEWPTVQGCACGGADDASALESNNISAFVQCCHWRSVSQPFVVSAHLSRICRCGCRRSAEGPR